MQVQFKKERAKGRLRGKNWQRAYDMSIKEQIGDPLSWPVNKHPKVALHLHDMRMKLLKPLKHNDRFRVTTFLLANGVSPYHIGNYMSTNGSLSDDSAVRDVKGIIKRYRQREPRLMATRAYDLQHRRFMKLSG